MYFRGNSCTSKDFEASITVVGEKGIAKVGGIGLNKIDDWQIFKIKIKKKKKKIILKNLIMDMELA